MKECRTRRDFLKRFGAIGLTAVSAGALSILPGCAGINQIFEPCRKKKPNIVFVLTDDQGYGDLGCHGNKDIKTPNLDRFAKESVELSQFYVSPVCAPTRASLMTGRYNYRTRVTDTYLGRAMMDPQEVTIAELLRDSNYATGIFGKWHLGDHYPMRPIDQGFEEAIVHTGGFIGEKSGPPGNSYFNPTLMHNGKTERFEGYCANIFTSKAMNFIEKNKDRSFFVYLALNTPHFPLQVSDEYADPYRAKKLEEKTALVYGMVTNIDDNFGRLLAKLKELKLDDSTIVIFMTDNGPDLVTKDRYTAGLRGSKGYVYEGGIRVPCFISWPSGFKGARQIDRLAAHIDILPTLLDACDVKKPKGLTLDGVSLMPLLCNDKADWPDRTLYFQWHRGDEPVPYRGFTARSQRYKLVQAQGIWTEDNVPSSEFKFELFDIINDPFEKKNISAQKPEVFEKMKKDYFAWLENVSKSRGFEPPDIVLGTKYENPVTLSRQDWRRARGCGLEDSTGYWKVEVARAGNYEITLRLSAPEKKGGQWRFQLGNVDLRERKEQIAAKYTFKNVHLEKGTGWLEAWVETEEKKVGVKFVDVKRVN